MNKIYINVDTVKKLLELDAKNIHLALEVIPKVKDILKKFDGKKITKRIQTALDVLDCDEFHISTELRNDRWNIEIYMHHRNVCSKPDKNGCCGAAYCNYDCVSLLPLCNKRTVIDYKDVEKEIDNNIVQLQYAYESHIEDSKKVSEYVKRYNDMVDEYDRCIRSMGSGFRSYAGI